MTEQEVKQEEARPVSPEQAYFEEVLTKFNTNPEDPSLQDIERVLLAKVQTAQKSISELSKQVENLNTEIRERQEKGSQLVQQLVHLQGQSQGYVDSLLALR